ANVQRAAKNVIYAVGTSNAMDTVSEDGTVKEATPLWVIALIILDIVVVALSLFFVIRTLIAHIAYIKTLPKKEKEEVEEGDDIVKKEKVIVIVIMAVIISLLCGFLGHKLFSGGGSGSAEIAGVYVYGVSVENDYGGENYDEYELMLYEDGTYKLTMTEASYAYSMLLSNTSVSTYGTYEMGEESDGNKACSLSEANRIIYNGYSDVGGYNLSYDTASESISYPVELPGGVMVEEEDFKAQFGAARTALLNTEKTSQMTFAE
nr:hypothetical protein [Lachnospiraceae bacterium]